MFVWIVSVTQLLVPAQTVVHGLLHKRGIQVHSSSYSSCALSTFVLQQLSPLEQFAVVMRMMCFKRLLSDSMDTG